MLKQPVPNSLLHALRNVKPGHWIVAITLIMIAVTYIWLAFIWLIPGIYWSPDSGYRHIQAHNIQLSPTLNSGIDYPGRSLDPDMKFSPFPWNFTYIQNGTIHFIYSPVLAILSSPFIALAGDRGELVIPVLSGLISLVILGRIFVILKLKPSWLGILMAGLATPLWFYSLNFWEHTLSIALALSSVMFILIERPRRRDYLLSGMFIAVAGAIREEMLIFGAAIGLMLICYGRFKTKGALLWLAGAIFPILLYLVFNYLITGSWLPAHLTGIYDYLKSGLNVISQTVNIVISFILGSNSGAPGGFVCMALMTYAIIARYPQTAINEGMQIVIISGFTLVMWKFLSVQTDGSLRGLVSVSPFLVLALLPADRAIWWLGRLRFIVISTFILTALIIGVLVPPDIINSGREWGTRYLLMLYIIIVPLAFNGLLFLFRRAKASWLAKVHLCFAAILVGLSVFIEIAGIQQLYDNNRVFAEAKNEYLTLPDKQVITNIWWLPVMASEIYESKYLYNVAPDQLKTWIAQANDAGIQQFVFIDGQNLPLDDSFLKDIAPNGKQLHETSIKPFGILWRSIEFRIDP